MGRELARLVDVELRAVPVGALLVAHQQHAELVDAVGDLVDHQALALLLVPGSCRRTRAPTASPRRTGGRRSARSAGRRPCVAVAQREVVGDRDRFVVRDQEAVERPLDRRPGAHARDQARAGSGRSPRRSRTRGARRRGGSAFSCVPQPSSAGWQPSRDEAVDRPGVDELADLLGLLGDLGVALGDVDHLDAEVARQLAPSPRGSVGLARVRPVSRARLSSACLTKCETRPGLAPWAITAVGPPRYLRRELQHVLAQRVVGAQRRPTGWGRCSRPATARCRCRGRARPSPGRARPAPSRRPRPTG